MAFILASKVEVGQRLYNTYKMKAPKVSLFPGSGTLINFLKMMISFEESCGSTSTTITPSQTPECLCIAFISRSPLLVYSRLHHLLESVVVINTTASTTWTLATDYLIGGLDICLALQSFFFESRYHIYYRITLLKDEYLSSFFYIRYPFGTTFGGKKGAKGLGAIYESAEPYYNLNMFPPRHKGCVEKLRRLYNHV
eukprot:gene649-366_t